MLIHSSDSSDVITMSPEQLKSKYTLTFLYDPFILGGKKATEAVEVVVCMRFDPVTTSLYQPNDI